MNERQEGLFKGLETYREYFLYSIQDVTEEEAEIIPEGFRNNIRWNMGHTYLDQYLWIMAVTREKDEEIIKLNKWFGFGKTLADFTDETPTFSELKEMLKKQINDVKEKYAHRLEEIHPPTEMEPYTTIEQALVRTAFHEGMHLQTINDIKKFIHKREE
ncbi:DinB family protein [Alkalibacillus haloalkaliphilus]|uniref:DinB family protein n=1 Tax=Alkalibacillus haloalkaliphilus TaxID=94136 RepID=UPI0003139931|nr:DinB family protein [Alkalibacillus haloalkaliphilus]